jgi:hypothetical protein
MAATFICFILLIEWSPWGLPGAHGRGLTAGLVCLLAGAALTYMLAIIDANMGARRGKRRSGWDV